MSEINGENIKWLIRTESDRQLGPYSTETILKMIRDGSLGGSEQIKRYPDGKWTKLSRHVDFYDQLLETLENLKTPISKAKPVEDYTTVNFEFNKIQQNKKITEMTEPLEMVEPDTAPQFDDFERTQIIKTEVPVIDDQEFEKTKLHIQPPPIEPSPLAEKKNRPRKKVKPKKAIFFYSLVAIIIGFFGLLLIEEPKKSGSGKINLLHPRSNASALDPEKTLSYFKAAISDFEKSTFEDNFQAQNKLVAVIEGAPRNVDARGTLCLVYKELWPFAKQDIKDMDALFNMAKGTRSLDPTGINSIYCEISKLMIMGKNKEARGVVDYALNLSQFATAPVLYQLKAELLGIEDDFKSASLYAEKAVALWPEWTKPILSLGAFEALNNRFPEAVNAYKDVLKKYPAHKLALIQMGTILYRSYKKIDDAYNFLTAAVASKSLVTNTELAQAHFFLALIYSEKRAPNKAKENAKMAFVLNPSDSNIKELYTKLGGSSDLEKNGVGYSDLMFLGDQHLRGGNCLAAQAEFKAAFEMDPTNGLAAMKAGQCLWQINQTSESIAWLRKAISADSSILPAYVLLADFLSQRYEYAAAIETLNKAAQKSSNNHEILRGFGLVEFRRNNLKDAIGFLNRANKIFENDIETLILLARTYLSDGSFSEAQKAAVRAIEIDSTNVEAQVVYAQVLTQFQGVDAGILYLKELIKKYSYTIQYRMALGDILREQERASQAQQIYLQILQIEPKNKSALIGVGRAYQAQGIFDKALKAFLTASIYDPSDAEGLMRAGILYLDSQKYADAINQFKRAISVNPLYPRLNYLIGRAYYNSGEFELALQAVMSERKINPNIADSYILAAEIYSASRQFQKCAAEYQQAIKLRPQGADLYVRIAKCYRQNGSPEIAESMLAIAAGQESGLPEIYREQGAVFEAKGDLRAAVESYNKYLTLSPNAPDKAEVENRILNLGK